jgi:hypothetical protein
LVVVAGLGREKKISIPKIPEIPEIFELPELGGRNREKKKIFSA